MTKRQNDFHKARRAAARKIPTKRDSALNESLAWICGDLASAYRIGVEEAQNAIVYRLNQLAIEAEGPTS